jgi:hypothetical protein
MAGKGKGGGTLVALLRAMMKLLLLLSFIQVGISSTILPIGCTILLFFVLIPLVCPQTNQVPCYILFPLSYSLATSYQAINASGKVNSNSAAQMFLRQEIKGNDESKSSESNKLGPCKTCIYVLERIKQGYEYLLPSICVEIHANNQQAEDFGKCQETIANLSVMGANVKSWFLNGWSLINEHKFLALIASRLTYLCNFLLPLLLYRML